jgi:hypothetical protein
MDFARMVRPSRRDALIGGGSAVAGLLLPRLAGAHPCRARNRHLQNGRNLRRRSAKTVTSKMGGTYAAAETHAVMGDRPLGAYARVVEAAAVPAIRYSPAGIVVKAKVIRACRGTSAA